MESTHARASRTHSRPDATGARQHAGRIAFFLADLRGGGAQRAMLHLAEGMAERGRRVDLLLAKASGPLLAEVSPAVRVVDLGARRTATSFPALVGYLRRERPDALVAALNHANLLAAWARRVAGVPTPVVASIQVNLSSAAQRGPDTASRLMPLLLRGFHRSADHIVAVSDGVADDFARSTGVPRERIAVIYNPVVTGHALRIARDVPDHPWFAPGEPPVVLGVGRLTRQKDFATLIRAFALVRRERAARLVILGEGEDRAPLEALVRELDLATSVALPGFMPNAYAFMAHAGVFVLSSAWEGLPSVLIESLAVGTPVVATDCPDGPREILRGGELGPLVPVGDAAELARRIVEVLDRGRGAIPREAWLPYSQDVVVDDYLRLIEEPALA